MTWSWSYEPINQFQGPWFLINNYILSLDRNAEGSECWNILLGADAESLINFKKRSAADYIQSAYSIV